MAKLTLRRFTPGDEHAISALTRQNLLGVNLRDYPLAEMERLAAQYTPGKVAHMAKACHLWVALRSQGPIVGCGAVSLHESITDAVYIHAVFVDASHHGCGIGAAILHRLERDDWALGAKRLTLNSSLTAERFYRRQGYTYPGNTRTVVNGAVPMEKWLTSAQI